MSLGKTAPERHRGCTSGLSLPQTGIERGTQMGPTGRGMSPSEVTDSKRYFIHRKKNLTARVTQCAAGTHASHPSRGVTGFNPPPVTGFSI